MPDFNSLDPFIPPQIRSAIEQNYYARVNEQAQLRQALKDPLFLPHPTAHAALYADHGVVHVRDVAEQILQVLESIHVNWSRMLLIRCARCAALTLSDSAVQC